MDSMNKKDCGGMLQIVYGDVTLGLHGTKKGREFSYLFSYKAEGMESLAIDGKEWLYRVPKPTFWRATTDNDRGNKFSCRSSMWLGADLFTACSGAVVYVEGIKTAFTNAPANNCYSNSETAGTVKIVYSYETATVPSTQTEVSYEVNGEGDITVGVQYFGNKDLPELPVFGMRFIMPTKAVCYRYEGLSGETYPDRMAGGMPGIYEVSGMPVTKYLVPQDCGMHMETNWLEVYRNTTLNNACQDTGSFGLKFTSIDKNFAFTCIPYTAEELENATHQEELPAARRTVVSILGAVRGVGGIDSWGADVEEAFHIDAGKNIAYSFKIEGVI